MPSSVLEGRTLLLSAAVTLLAVAAATPRQSAPDQYEQQRGDRAPLGAGTHPPPPLHRVQLAHTGYHRFGLLPATIHQQPLQNEQHQKNTNVPELQVGCAEGSLHERTTTPNQQAPIEVLKSSIKLRHKRETDDLIQWYQIPQRHKVIQSYQLRSNVPYYIPVWGNPSRVPVFFPPKPILFNPGYPALNRPQPTPRPDKTVTIKTRVRGDRPSWGVVEPRTTPPPAAPSARPTRPRPPPLLHRPSVTETPQQQNAEDLVISENIQMVFATSTTRPPPLPTPAAQISAGSPASGSSSGPPGINRCVWAIISCCNPASTQVKGSCFEQLGCPGSFWDSSPCSRDVTLAALKAAQKFYDQS